MRYRFLDLFAGCGGLGDGFEGSGRFEGVAHVEWERAPAQTLVRRLQSAWNYPDAPSRVFVADVRSLTGISDDPSLRIRREWDHCLSAAGTIDVVIGGPPCQAYSVAGRVRDANGMHDDYRNFLFEAYVGLLRLVQPTAFIFENVPGMLSAAPGGVSISDRVSRSFSDAGYAISHNLRDDAMFDVADFGIAQHRKRVIIVGFRKNCGFDATKQVRTFYSTVRERRVATLVTAEEAIGDLPKLLPVYGVPGVSHASSAKSADVLHIPRFHSARDVEVFRMLAADAATGGVRFGSVDARKALYTQVTGRVASIHKYHVILPSRPSNLIPAHLHKDGLRHIHWDSSQARSITAREAARFQSFPDDYPFMGSRSDIYKMIGNAVPPKFSRILADVLFSSLSQIRRGV